MLCGSQGIDTAARGPALKRRDDLVTSPGRGERDDPGHLGRQLVGPARGGCTKEVLGDRCELQERSFLAERGRIGRAGGRREPP